ncbi:TetR/AcrR family transcriptional regulator [Mycobacterium spongiae]|uniref:TetR family transcriptional regulator n=1 Tax=Mycobacterium spongiae TaxID=886343 RepID=A0A975PX22_9MYCO|nr:TetR/AcrR family transcriptional regulator [Mycobacterium spongiae]QUR67364.1 TetR family transcriptional regulator [Mycobacterium spongiae]
MLSDVMRLFWQKGYEKVSMEEIVQVSGLNRYAIYQNWGGKAELYAMCLRQYSEMFIETAFAPLASGSGGLDDIRAAFDTSLALFDTGDSANGCMACRALVEPVYEAPAITEQVETHFSTIKTLFAQALARARERREIAEDADIDALAEYLVGIVQGAQLFGLRGVDKSTVDSYFRIAVAALQSRPSVVAAIGHGKKRHQDG